MGTCGCERGGWRGRGVGRREDEMGRSGAGAGVGWIIWESVRFGDGRRYLEEICNLPEAWTDMRPPGAAFVLLSSCSIFAIPILKD